MIQTIPIEPINDAHAVLIVQAFNNYLIEDGGWRSGSGNGEEWGYGLKGLGDGFGNGDGWGNGLKGNGYGFGEGYGFGGAIGCGGNTGKVPEEWVVADLVK